VRYKIAKTARQHKIGNAHIRASVAGRLPDNISRELFKGKYVTVIEWKRAIDDRGLELYILGRVAVEDPSLIILFHVHPLTLWNRGK